MNGSGAAPSAARCFRGRLAAEYEELRRQVLEGSGHGCGLILFLRRGMRAWIEEPLRPAAANAAPRPGGGPWAPRPSPTEAVLLLAGMALAAGKEVRC